MEVTADVVDSSNDIAPRRFDSEDDDERACQREKLPVPKPPRKQDTRSKEQGNRESQALLNTRPGPWTPQVPNECVEISLFGVHVRVHYHPGLDAGS